MSNLGEKVVKTKMLKTTTSSQNKKHKKALHPVHSDISDRVVMIMLVTVVVISLLSLGLYVYTLGEGSLAAPTGQAIVEEAPPQGVITLEILPQPSAANQDE